MIRGEIGEMSRGQIWRGLIDPVEKVEFYSEDHGSL